MLTTNEPRPTLDWRSAVWFWPYLFGMAAISHLSSFDTRTPSSIPLLGLHGPRNAFTFGWDILAVALLSLAVYAVAIRSRLPGEQALENVGDLTTEGPAAPPRPAAAVAGRVPVLVLGKWFFGAPGSGASIADGQIAAVGSGDWTPPRL